MTIEEAIWSFSADLSKAGYTEDVEMLVSDKVFDDLKTALGSLIRYAAKKPGETNWNSIQLNTWTGKIFITKRSESKCASSVVPSNISPAIKNWILTLPAKDSP